MKRLNDSSDVPEARLGILLETNTSSKSANIRDQNPSLGMICPGDPHQRNPNAPKFEDRSQEETEWQERCAREPAWRLAKIS